MENVSVFFCNSYGDVRIGFLFPYEIAGGILSGEIQPDREGRKNAAASDAPQIIPTALGEEPVINADTQYIIEEVDLKKDTSVETKWKVPDKYIGMNRQQFIKEMELYQQSPSLKDQELGFVSAEVVTFSKERVVVRKSYIFKELCTSFYLVNEKNYVVVYCDDLKTVYMNTNIALDSLPDTLKQEIIQNKYIATEEELYNFLESYSS